MTTDDLKLLRDGHLEYGKVPSSQHAWVRPVHEFVERLPNGNVLTTCDGGRSHIEWSSDRPQT